MIVQAMSLREAGNRLGIESWRVLRLARYLHLDPSTSLVPLDVVNQIGLLENDDERSQGLREWVLDHNCRHDSEMMP